jgi:DNA polymerase III alpha subunit (gram-positive type)
MKATYLAFDTETGGLDPKKTSLLTAYFAVLDENFNAIAELDLKIKGDKNEIYHVTGEALKINGINLSELHNENRNVTKGLAAVQLSDLIRTHSGEGQAPLIPIGHNVNFDIGFINEHLIPKEMWDRYVSYHLLDTASAANFLKAKGLIPQTVRGSLASLAKHYNIDVSKGTLHNAKMDTVVAVAILQAMLKV